MRRCRNIWNAASHLRRIEGIRGSNGRCSPRSPPRSTGSAISTRRTSAGWLGMLQRAIRPRLASSEETIAIAASIAVRTRDSSKKCPTTPCRTSLPAMTHSLASGRRAKVACSLGNGGPMSVWGSPAGRNPSLFACWWNSSKARRPRPLGGHRSTRNKSLRLLSN